MHQMRSEICNVNVRIAMSIFVRLKLFIYLYSGGLLLILAGLHQTEGASAEMANMNWKPFIYGGMASIVAEFGKREDVM